MSAPAIRIVGWQRWQGRAVSEIERKRKVKDRPVRLDYIAVASRFGDEFADFQSKVAHPFADALLLRVLQFIASTDARTGTISVPRHLWGARVVGTDWAEVEAGLGERVHDALLASGLAVRAESGAEHGAPDGAEASAPDGAPDGAGRLRLDQTVEDPPARATTEPEPTTAGPYPSASLRAHAQADGWRVHDRDGGWPKWGPALQRLAETGLSLDQIGAVVKPAPIAHPHWKVIRPLEDVHAPPRRNGRAPVAAPDPVREAVYARLGTVVNMEDPQ